VSLVDLAGRARPVVLAAERVLPVLDPLVPLLPEGGLRRGSVVACQSAGESRASNGGATSLALALLAGASAAGSWCAAVGLPSLGVVAAAELGVVLERFPLVASPSQVDEWAWAVAALFDAMDVVLARPPGRVSERLASRLAARARERSAVLVVAGRSRPAWPERNCGGWPLPPDIRLDVVAGEWEGVGQGDGRLRARRVEVVAGGRGAAARERRVSLWLPGPDGGVAAAATGVAVPVEPHDAVEPHNAVEAVAAEAG
jgi:hypothetical protein